MPITYWLKFGNTPLGYNGNALKSTYVPPGGLSITCNASISGSGFDTTKQFGCTVTFNAVVPYTLDGVAQTPASSVHLFLVKDQVVVLGNLPAGTTYSITEDPISPADQELGYSNGAVTGATGTIAEDTTSAAALGYAYVDPIASLPKRTIRFEFTNSSYDPSVSFISGDQTYRWTRVSSSPNRWDCYCPGTDWTERFSSTPDNNVHFGGQSTGDIHVLGANLSEVTNCTDLFAWDSKFTSIKGLFNTSSVTNAKNMFYVCDRLTYVATFDTHNVTNMWGMFDNCVRLASAPVLSTEKVTNMSFMFNHCYDLVDVPQYDTKNVTNMLSMFSECRSLKRVPQFNMAKVTNIDGMFSYCPLLEEAPSFMSGTVTSMAKAFYNCTSLTAIPAINVANIEDAFGTFYNCRAIPSGILAMYQALSSTGKVDPATRRERCFYNCGIDTTTGAAELAQIPSDWK